jgi:molecular chaperone GrpE
VGDDVKSGADKTAREQLERNDEVAASAAPQGDGVPDNAGPSETPESEPGGDDEDSEGNVRVAGESDRAVAELRDKYLRLAAEFDNYRKRVTRERAELSDRAQAQLTLRLVDTLDDLDRVVSAQHEGLSVDGLREAVQLVERKLWKELQSAGLERVDPVGEPFDPALHEAVSVLPPPTPEQDHLVSATFQAGYRFKGALVRPARVQVYSSAGDA